MTLQQEFASIERALQHAPQELAALEALLASLGPGATLDQPAVLDAIPHTYLPSRKEHCALAPHHKERAVVNGDLILLGARAREDLLPAGSINRALDLLNCHGGPPEHPRSAFWLSGCARPTLLYDTR